MQNVEGRRNNAQTRDKTQKDKAQISERYLSIVREHLNNNHWIEFRQSAVHGNKKEKEKKNNKNTCDIFSSRDEIRNQKLVRQDTLAWAIYLYINQLSEIIQTINCSA